jgi:hydroxymethylpyrimidine/phosphomethylpyrimidine kinase
MADIPMADMPRTARLLVIAGSDSSAGAGLQADLKTAQAFGVYAQTAVTAVTVQDTEEVHSVHLVAPEIVHGQIVAALSDIGADAIKIGMLGSGRIASAVADILENIDVPVVLDPVLAASSGVPLLDDLGVAVLKTRLIPRALLLTPNLPEAEALTGIRPRSPHTLRNAAQAFMMLGAKNIFFKGGHAVGDTVKDVLVGRVGEAVFESPRQQTPHTHGTGCTLSTAIASGLALGLTLEAAVARAHRFVQNAILSAPGLGRGHGPLNHRHEA